MKGVLRYLSAVGVTALLVGAHGTAWAQKDMVLEMPTYQHAEGFGVWWRALGKEFERQNPGVTFKLVPNSFGEHHDQLTTRLVAGNPPDIAHISARFFFGLADQGLLDPLDERLAAAGWKEADYIPAQKGMRRGGKIYAQVLLGYGWGLFYNKDMLDKAGVSVPTNRADFLAAAKKLTVDRDNDGRIDQSGWGLTISQASQSYMDLTFILASYDKGWVSDGKLVSLADLKNAMGLLGDQIAAKVTPVGLDHFKVRQLFWQGNAAMYIDGSWAVAFKKDAADSVKTAYRVADVPFAAQASGPSNVLAIPAALPPERKDLAWKFIALAQSPEWQAKYASMSGNPPALKGAIDDEARKAWPELAVFEKSAGGATHNYLPVGKETDFAKFSKIAIDGVAAMASGAKSADEAAEQIHDELSREFF